MAEKTQDRLIKIRESLGLTQKEFCKGIYVSQTYYSNIENGNKKINDRVIALITSQYGVNKEYLLTGKGEIFSENLPDIHLNQLLEIFNDLEKPFKEFILQVVRQLAESLKKSKEDQKPSKGKKTT